jgi:hypothetical protein
LPTIKYRGVVYDVGLYFEEHKLSVEPFAPSLVECDMRAIANDPHANAIQIEGELIDRLVIAARTAHALGLTVFFNPWKMNADIDETGTYLKECALAAEQLRIEGADIIFVAGCKYIIFSKRVFPSDCFKEQVAWLGAQMSPDTDLAQNIPNSCVSGRRNRKKSCALSPKASVPYSRAQLHIQLGHGNSSIGASSTWWHRLLLPRRNRRRLRLWPAPSQVG